MNPAAVRIGAHVGPYEIISPIGAGGMGQVYRARDARLGREVAIKVLPPDFAADPDRLTRFTREARIVAALNHPNIVTIYDVGDVDGAPYIALELIAGETLRARLDRERLPLVEAVALAVQIADALAHAHAAGLVHRDLNPRNIMVTADGHAKVLDFGLGKFVVTGPALDAISTMSGGSTIPQTILGTVGYMSPEQVTGAPIDSRSDQFAFGAVLYEMLTGVRAFRKESDILTLAAIVESDPPPLRRLTRRIPRALAAIVERCLAKQPVDRYARTDDCMQALRAAYADALRTTSALHHVVYPAAAASVLLAGLAGIAYWDLGRRADGSQAASSSITLAVLPPIVNADDADTRAYSSGLMETITNRLLAVPVNHRVEVVPMSDVTSRKVKSIDDARLELGATRVLRSTFDRDRVRLELVDAKSGASVGSATVGMLGRDPAASEDRILDASLSLLGVSLRPEERTRLAAPQVSLGAYELYLQGLGYLQDYDKPENIDVAVTVFQHALEIDPRSAVAYAGLGDAYWRKYVATRDARFVDTARQACEHALGLDATLAAPHDCLGTVEAGTGDYEGAAEQFERALERDPADGIADLGLATAYQKLGRPQAAEQEYLRAIKLRPRYWTSYSRLGAFYYSVGRYSDAERMFRQVITLTPDSWRGYSNIGALYYVQGRFDDAIAAYRQSLALRPNYQAASNLGTLYYFKTGDYKKAAEAYGEALKMNGTDHVVWGNYAAALQSGGDEAGARRAFAKAAELAEARRKVNPRDAAVLMALAQDYGGLGDLAKVVPLMEEALHLAPDDVALMYKAGLLYESPLGRRALALEWLARAVDRGYQWQELERSPTLARLRQDPRFEDLRRAAARRSTTAKGE